MCIRDRVSVVPLLSGLDVYADADADSIVVIGDSTTSNYIPKLRAKRIMDETGENKVGVLQKSIVGNCLLSDGVGPTGSIYGTVSYTHLDVYKRQAGLRPRCRAPSHWSAHG